MSPRDSNNPKTAVALHYSGEGAPRVTAKGKSDTARRIEALAKEHGVPLQRDAELTHMLAQVPLGDEIPPALYRAVSSVIAFAYEISGKSIPLNEEADEKKQESLD